MVVSGLADADAAKAVVDQVNEHLTDLVDSGEFGPTTVADVAAEEPSKEEKEEGKDGEAKGEEEKKEGEEEENKATPDGHWVRFKVTLADVESADAFTEEKQAAFKAAIATAVKVDEAKVAVDLIKLVHGVLTPGKLLEYHIPAGPCLTSSKPYTNFVCCRALFHHIFKTSRFTFTFHHP